MPTVRSSDEASNKLQRVALDEAERPLTPSELLLVMEADAAIEAGRFHTMDRVEEQIAAERTAWLAERAH
ncbi:hypothetical protein EON81_00120 [bacterium]|nr:MAG: hypothetical protein EON81_00120 [bacterium]